MNDNFDDVLIKVCSLDNLYGTQIFHPFPIAKHIVTLKIDNNLAQNDLTIVNKIAKVEINGSVKNFYSFATKFCSHHKPIIYPIYDSYVEKMIMYFKKENEFDDFLKEDLRSYVRYKGILENFRKFYKIEMFDYRQIDKYLWQAGKKYFPKSY